MSATRYTKPRFVAGEASWAEIALHARRLRSAYLGALVRDAFAALTASRRTG